MLVSIPFNNKNLSVTSGAGIKWPVYCRKHQGFKQLDLVVVIQYPWLDPFNSYCQHASSSLYTLKIQTQLEASKIKQTSI
jgi:hypothetical protein